MEKFFDNYIVKFIIKLLCNIYMVLVFNPDIKLKKYDQGGTRSSIETDTNGKRVQMTYHCARYDVEKASWERDCQTVYDTTRPGDGVLCLCSHNTSFAVLMVRVG